MEFKDWRTSRNEDQTTSERPPRKKYYGKRFEDYISEQIREAEARGEFENLRGFGKPLNLTSNVYAGDKAAGYNLLKSNNYAPQEIELAKEIHIEHERAESKIARLKLQSRALRSRQVTPFPGEKRAFNTVVEKAAADYEKTLTDLNRKILTFNLMTPMIMHQLMLDVEKLVQDFRKECPPLD